ncbi:MAG: cupin domain-containing protein [Pirellulaceae bacterium]|nr:cupin domain-containing protein [Planctomycetales bacterium]
MAHHRTESRYLITRPADMPVTPCPCGEAQRAFTDDPQQIASLHVVQISKDSRTHYHRCMTEIYYVLEGVGHIELDGDRFDLSPGVAIMIKPGCRHRAVGKLKILNVPIPAFDPTDEWFDDE